MGVFYELFGQANIANGQQAVIGVLNEQLASPSSQDIFQHKHLVVEDVPFQTYKFDSFGLGSLFGSRTELPFIGMRYFHTDTTQLSTIYV